MDIMFAMPKLQQVDPTKTRQKEELGVTKRIKPSHPEQKKRRKRKKAPEQSENGKSQASPN